MCSIINNTWTITIYFPLGFIHFNASLYCFTFRLEFCAHLIYIIHSVLFFSFRSFATFLRVHIHIQFNVSTRQAEETQKKWEMVNTMDYFSIMIVVGVLENINKIVPVQHIIWKLKSFFVLHPLWWYYKFLTSFFHLSLSFLFISIYQFSITIHNEIQCYVARCTWTFFPFFCLYFFLLLFSSITWTFSVNQQIAEICLKLKRMEIVCWVRVFTFRISI